MENLKAAVANIRQTDNYAPMNDKVSKQKKIIESSANVLKTQLQKAFAMHLEQVEQQLYDTSDSKNTDAIHLDIKVLQKASKYLSSLYIDSISKNLMSFSTDSNIGAENTFFSSKEDKGWASLQLLETDEVENQLLIDGYVSASESQLIELLYALKRRIEFVSNVNELPASRNPYGPSVLMKTYVELIKGESFSKITHKILCDSFNRTVLSNIGDTLEEINELFIEAEILLKLPKPNLKRSASVDKKGVKSPVEEKKVFTPAEQAKPEKTMEPQVDQVSNVLATKIEPVLYSSLVEMAQVYRFHGGKKASDGLAISGEQLATTDLISTLDEIQKQGAIDGVEPEDSVRSQIGSKIQVDGHRQPYSEQDDILIDVVAMFFDVILQDRHLPDVVRAMIGQLQIPILKVAMMDKEFFAKKSHPARRFLNALSHAGLGVSEKNKQIQSATFEKMEELVARVLMEFESDIEIFAELVEEFEIFQDQQQQQINLIEERSRKMRQGAEQLELTKRQAAYEIALRLNGKSIPEFVHLFLDNAWKDVLVLALLRREKEPEETRQTIAVIERLVNSVIATENKSEKHAIKEGLARLLKDIKVGLENISYDFHEALPFFKELESWHRQILSVNTTAVDDIPVAERVALVDFDKDFCEASLDEELLQELEGELKQMPKDKFSKQANNIQVGDWLEYKNESGAALRAKLSWKSPVTMSCLFVNDRGAKAMDITVAELAEQLRQKSMSLVGQEKTPLVERVLLGMKKMMTPNEPEPYPA
tara:strand:+ start:513 stop:2807 length:2295 start_codon:yes stop_codon:yes gene_type:complete